MSFSSEVKEELNELKIWDNKSPLRQDEQIARLCIREAFIKSGFISNPNKEYHLEILFKTNKKAQEMKSILNSFNINPKIIKKGKDIMIYIKESEEISKFLALIGANKTVLKFEGIRVEKEARNNINRIVNCETANLDKIMNISNIQIENIKLIKAKNEFKNLPKALQEVAELRLKNSDASYEDLGKLLKNPISKSGVNHRLRRISEIAEELKYK